VYRFLLSWRWVALGVAVLGFAVLAVRLGLWQFERVGERSADNARIETNLAADPVPVHELASPDRTVDEAAEWRTVTASGSYDAARQLVVRYQSRESGRGVSVLTPLVLPDGTGLLVERGWQPGNADPAEVPVPPSGPVTVTGWWRTDSRADGAATEPEQGQVRAISSAALADWVPYPLMSGYVALTEQVPPVAVGLLPAEPPQLGSGPHLFYGLQWFFFAGLAVCGAAYLAWSEAHPRRRGHRARSIPPSTGTMAPLTNEAAGESRNAATLPNSSGRP